MSDLSFVPPIFGLQSQASQVPLHFSILSPFERFVIMLVEKFFDIGKFVVDFVSNLAEGNFAFVSPGLCGAF